MPTPKNANDIKRFLDMLTYYARFISNITSSLRQLRKDFRFKWTTECEKSKYPKKELTSERGLMPYKPDLEVQLACDASSMGILPHIVDGHERPTAFASRALTPIEQNYSQFEQHFYEYLFARSLKLITDNQPIMRTKNQQ